MRRAVVWGLLGFIGLFLLSCGGMGLPLDFLGNLAFGWALFLRRGLPRVTIDWGGVATAALCLALFSAGSHAFLRWLHGQLRAGGEADGPSVGRWKARWTGSMVAVVVLMFVAGLSAAGVVHQVGWLLTSGEPVLGSSSWAVRRAQSANNLKQIGIGLANYQDTHATFPPGGTFDARGRPMLGWLVMLLPYLDQQALYDRIDFDRPWDHPRNREVFRTAPTMYLNPSILEREDESGYALSHYSGNARLLGGDVARSLAEVADGTSATIIVGEVATGFRPWGHPVHWRDPTLGINRSPEGFGSPFPGGANFLFADGSARFVRESVDPKVLEALGTPAGGEALGPEEY